MLDDVTVIDDFLPPALFGRLLLALNSVPLVFGAKSNNATDSHGHWQKNFSDEGRFNLSDIAGDVRSVGVPAGVADLMDLLADGLLQDHVLIRCYVNAYTYGTDGYFHRDSTRSDDVTVILYIVDDWRPDWSGETVFLDENAEIGRAILPRRNRCVIFDANIPHAARSVSRQCTSLRTTLIYKWRRRGSADLERLSQFLLELGANCYEHQCGTLHDHLYRTFKILEEKGYPKETCVAGGLHAIYGTKYYKVRLLEKSSRKILIDAFGADIERLVRLFSLIDPVQTFSNLQSDEGSVLISRDGRRRLAVPESLFLSIKAIAMANFADQGTLPRFPRLLADAEMAAAENSSWRPPEV